MDLYTRYQKSGRARNGSLTFPATQTTKTLITPTNSGCTLNIQRLVVVITTSAAQSLTLQDTAGTPIVIAQVPSTPGAYTRWDFDFGAKGIPLTIGTNLQAAFSAAGLAGTIEWTGYQTPTMLSANPLPTPVFNSNS